MEHSTLPTPLSHFRKYIFNTCKKDFYFGVKNEKFYLTNLDFKIILNFTIVLRGSAMRDINMCLDFECSMTQRVTMADAEAYFESFAWI